MCVCFTDFKSTNVLFSELPPLSQSVNHISIVSQQTDPAISNSELIYTLYINSIPVASLNIIQNNINNIITISEDGWSLELGELIGSVQYARIYLLSLSQSLLKVLRNLIRSSYIIGSFYIIIF